MSRINFHSEHQTVSVYGRARGHIRARLLKASHLIESFSTPFPVRVNAAIRNAPELRFIARIYATCEVYGFCEPQNLRWLSEEIRRNLVAGYLTEDGAITDADIGWAGLADWLLTVNGPVVMSYSVCDSFPPYYRTADGSYWHPEGEEMSDPVRFSWEDGMRWIRGGARKSQEEGTLSLELRPSEEDESRFFSEQVGTYA